MDLKIVYAKPKTTTRSKKNCTYPYLLGSLQIDRPNQVWQYIPMHRGFMYLVAVIDVYSRKTMNRSVSNTMPAAWCTEVLEDTIKKYGKPEIHNSGQGSQFTGEEFTGALKKNEIQISMDGKGRASDNVHIERFWRSVKQEKIYLNLPDGGVGLYQIIREHIEFYNNQRRHTEIGKIPPNQRFYNQKMVG